MGKFAKLAVCPLGRGVPRKTDLREQSEGTKQMEAYHIDRFGSVDGIVLRSCEDPRPGLREILMRVRASSLNYRDLMVLRGGGRGPTKLGVIPLSDGAGEVVAMGDGVTRAKLGDRIAGCFHPRCFGGPISPDYLTDRLGANLDGMLAEYAVLSEEALVHVPSHLSARTSDSCCIRSVLLFYSLWHAAFFRIYLPCNTEFPSPIHTST